MKKATKEKDTKDAVSVPFLPVKEKKKDGPEPFPLFHWDRIQVKATFIELRMDRIKTTLKAWKNEKMEFNSKKGLKAFEYACLIIEAEEARVHYFPPKMTAKQKADMEANQIKAEVVGEFEMPPPTKNNGARKADA